MAEYSKVIFLSVPDKLTDAQREGLKRQVETDLAPYGIKVSLLEGGLTYQGCVDLGQVVIELAGAEKPNDVSG